MNFLVERGGLQGVVALAFLNEVCVGAEELLSDYLDLALLITEEAAEVFALGSRQATDPQRHLLVAVGRAAHAESRRLFI